MGFIRDRICAVVAAHTAAEMVRQLQSAMRQARSVELRLDYLSYPRETFRFLDWLSHARRPATLIATCRSVEGGGLFLGDRSRQFEVLFRAGQAGCETWDVELEAAELYSDGMPINLLAAPRRIVSYHNFRETPANLRAISRQLAGAGGMAIKIATHCRTISDSVRLLELARGRRKVIIAPIGEAGLPARVLALRAGSALAYAAVEQKTAPGQLSLEEMRHVYRADQLDRRTRVYGVIGNPVGHSLSPRMHNAAFAARRMNAVYLPFLARDLRDFLRAIAPLGIAGFSVTLPHKERILRFLDDCDPLAARIGAANTVVVRGGGKLYGYNTDYVGVLRAIERRLPLRGSRVLLYGAGGAARAAAFALAESGAIVCICARRMARAEQLARAAGGEAIFRARLAREYFDAIVNCTPVGMRPRASEAPLAARELNCRIVMDMVYHPQRTRLLSLAGKRGIETISGIEMFLAQGAAQWEIWTGVRAPEKIMRRTVLAALRAEENRGR